MLDGPSRPMVHGPLGLRRSPGFWGVWNQVEHLAGLGVEDFHIRPHARRNASRSNRESRCCIRLARVFTITVMDSKAVSSSASCLSDLGPIAVRISKM